MNVQTSSFKAPTALVRF